ncbi:MAG: hypothetical protein EU530_09250 [Promethearchaeota archaeon]|nr:MAG: hypothetical protein EU530_09250 [Candidatus Lokiarchaeota archaeon]
MIMKSTENPMAHSLACFRIEDFKFFHTGDMKNCVVPDTIKNFTKEQYARIRFHVLIYIPTLDSFLLKNENSQDFPNTVSSFTTLIEYSPLFTYEYMESFVATQIAIQTQFSVSDFRFHKMQLAKTVDGSSELIYYLVGFSHLPDQRHSDNNFNVANRAQIQEHLKKFPIWEEITQKNFLNLESKSQKYPIGLIIGRFQPLHNGHVYLFKKALEIVECLKIGVGSSQMSNQPKNPFSFNDRQMFIEAALNDENIAPTDFEVYPIPDLFNFEKWMESIFLIVQNFDVIFTNNLWIGRLIQKRGKILIYGLKYNISKFNGTNIRELMRKGNLEWKSLVPSSIIPFLEQWLVHNRI